MEVTAMAGEAVERWNGPLSILLSHTRRHSYLLLKVAPHQPLQAPSLITVTYLLTQDITMVIHIHRGPRSSQVVATC